MRILPPFMLAFVFTAPIFSVWADEPQIVSPAEPVNDVATAKELNRKGLALLDTGDCAGALSFFESSRALVRSYANTRNAALCLDALGRKKEALAMFETLLADYADKLEEEERTVAEKRIAELRNELAPAPLPTPPVSSNPPAAVSVARQKEKRVVPGRWSVGGFVGYAGGSSLGSDAEAYVATNCTTNCPAMNGFMTGARLEFRLARLVTLEVSGGYLRLGSNFAQSWNDSGFTYTLDIERSFSGGFVDFGTSMRWPFGDRIGLVGRFAVGGLLANVTNENTGITKRKTGTPANLLVEGGSPSIDGRSLYIRPELGLEVNVLPFVLGAGIGAIVSMNAGPSFGELRLRTEVNECISSESGACAPDLDVSTGNQDYGVFVAFVPQIGVRFRFD